MKNLLIIAVTMLISVQLSAKNISGRVLSEKDSTEVTGAVCQILAGERNLAGTTSDAEGRFSITTDFRGKLTLSISMAGFTPTEILIEDGKKNVDLGTVYLAGAITLDGVTVTASPVFQSQGKTIVYPSSADVKASSTALSLFEKLPLAGLEANPINRTLSIDGASPMILINGVPSSIADVHALQPKEIERIEYSRMTPARYADRGVTGLINITLKKRNDGGRIYAWGRSALNTAFMDANINASYHQGPSQFSLYYNPSWRNYQKVYDITEQSYVGNDFRVDIESRDRNPFNYFTNIGRFKYNFSPTTRTLFSATFNLSSTTSKGRSYGSVNDTYMGDYTFDNANSDNPLSPSLDLFLRHDFNDRSSLEVQMVGTLSSSDYRRNNIYSFADGTSDSYVMDVNSRRRSLISEISYIHNFSDRTSLSAGFQNTLSHSRNTYLTSDYRPVLTENNNYVYARLGQQFGPVYLSASTGLKMFWVENDDNKRHFVRNLSQIQGQWNVNSSWTLSAAFSYSPSIPSLASLTDYMQQTSPYLFSNGNPHLKVAEYFTYQFMPFYRYKKFSTSLLLTYTDVKNYVISDMIYMGDEKFLSQSVNSRKRRYYDGTLNLRVSDLAGFGASLNLDLEHYYNAGDGWSHHLTSLSGRISLWWNKGPYTISYWRKLPGKYLSGHDVGKEENGDRLSFEYSPNKHWTVGASWMYMFDSKGTRYPSWNYSAVNPSARDRFIRNNGNMIVLSLTYNADFGSIFRSGRRSLNNSDRGSSLLQM